MFDNYPELGKQLPHVVLKIDGGERGTLQTLRIMRGVAVEASHDPRLRAIAIRIVAAIDPRNDHDRAASLLSWVQKNIRYVRDIRRCETIQTPQRTLIWRAGDCDDFSTLLASLLLVLGFLKIGFVAQKRVPGGSYKHVFVAVEVNGDWYKMDGTSRKSLHLMPWDRQRHYLSYV